MSRPSNAAVVLDEDTTNSIKTIIKEAAKAGLGAECMSVGEYALALIGDINVGPATDIAYGNSIKCYQQERHLKLMIRTMIAHNLRESNAANRPRFRRTTTDYSTCRWQADTPGRFTEKRSRRSQRTPRYLLLSL